jgi:3-methyl-2-oxobutanoate hydroxymethyltransferase
MITAVDAPTARIADAAGVDMILVGDSLAMVSLGHETTLSVTLEEMLHHARAVARAKPRALVVGDMPYLTYHLGAEEAVRNAARFLTEAGCQAVKIEGGRKRLRAIEAMRDAEIPVMGHLGLTPQSVHALGGFKVQAKTEEAADILLREARLLEQAGVFSLVLECVPAEVAAIVTREIGIPVIGIGAGAACDGQVLVMHDALGMSPGGAPLPRFVRTYAHLAEDAVAALTHFVEDVRAGTFPSASEAYHLNAATAEALAREAEARGSEPEGD